MTATRHTTVEAARETLDRAVERLLALQHPDGHWKGELETNVTIDAEDLFLRHYLGLLDERTSTATAVWIRSRQREDGSFATFFGGPPDLSTTVEAYVGLRLAGDAPDAEHMRRARSVVSELGGLEATRVFTRMWLSLLGLWSWDTVPVLPPEQMYLPKRAPLSIYSFGCWARQTIVALQIATALKPVRPVDFAIDELARGTAPPRPLLDRVLHGYARHPFGPLRRRALRTSVNWVIDRQEADGSWGGIQPPWVWSLIALREYGLPLDHPVLANGLAGLDTFTLEDELGRRIEACQSPVWDTVLALIALLDAGVDRDHPAVQRAAEWLVAREVKTRGDWAVRRPQLAPGGFPFEYANDNYPDIDDTAEVVMALRRSGVGTDAADRAVAWLIGMQSSNDGWAAFDVDNDSSLPRRLPFCDFGEVTDPPSADVTAHVLEALGQEGRADDPAVRRGIDWLLASRRPTARGSAAGARITSTARARRCPRSPRAASTTTQPSAAPSPGLTSVQNEDGGFGEDLRSYRDPAWRARGTSTASQTAWALLALHAAGSDGAVAEAAVRFLVDTQTPDGSWDEPFFTGTGFPGDFYLNYHLYRLVFPVIALGRIVNGERVG